MTVRYRLIMLAIAVILTANSLFSLAGVQYLGRIWLDEVQDRVWASLQSAATAYAHHERRIQDYLQATALNHCPVELAEELEPRRLSQALDRIQAAGYMDFITLLDPQGVVQYRPRQPSVFGDDLSHIPLVRHALDTGQPVSGTIVLSAEQLRTEHPELEQRARFDLLPTNGARATAERVRTCGLVIAAVVPIQDDDRKISGLLFGGDLLSRRSDIVDRIRDEVFFEESFEGSDVGTVTIFAGDLRIATNVLDDRGDRAVGTRLSAAVSDRVLRQGEAWSDKAYVVNDWYITAYQPIRDPDDAIVGALYVGLRQAPFAYRRGVITAVFLAGVMATTAVVLLLLLWATNWVLKPIHRIVEMSNRVVKGDLTARVEIRPPGEFGELCQAVDDMASTLQEREKSLEQAAKQQIGRSEKLASIGRLAAGIAHEINNPLTGVLTFAHLLRDRQPEAGQDREDLDLIIHETQRAAEVVQGLLDFARERPAAKRPIDLNSVIQRMVRLVENQKEMRKIHIEQDYGDNLPEILGDANQLQQVLLNLFLNAAAAMSGGGILTVTTRADPTHVILTVADNGCGIPPEHLDKVFDPFFTTKPVGQGTGLGLSVSYGIVEQHGGSIELESEVEIGTTFTIRLPLMPESSRGILEESERT
jgi:two-component system, NtrC family, sensor kinase